jgi:hypothetical protein
MDNLYQATSINYKTEPQAHRFETNNKKEMAILHQSMKLQEIN